MKKSGTASFRLGGVNPDTFNAKATFICTNSGNLEISHASQSVFRDSVFLNTTHSTAHISFCNSSTLATLEQEAVIVTGSTGLTNGKITLKALQQTSNKSNILNGTGNLLVNVDSCQFTGEVNITAPSILIKNNIFNAATTLIKTTASTNSYSSGGNIFNSTATIENQDATRAFRLANESGDTYNSDAKFDTGTNNVQVGYKGNNYFAGNITINSTKVVFNASTGKVILNGANNQIFYGEAAYNIGKLEINKDAGTVTLTRSMTIDSSITFINGIINTDSTITLKAAVNCSGASNLSFVDGPVKKIGNTAFVFPVGDEGFYRQIEITAPVQTTDAFTARYFYQSPKILSSSIDTSFTKLSTCNYWQLNRNTGNSNVYVTLYWDSLSCSLMDTASAKVVALINNVWTNVGSEYLTHDENYGKIKSGIPVSSYTAVSFGSTPQIINVTMSAGSYSRDIPDDYFGVNGSNTIDVDDNGNGLHTWEILHTNQVPTTQLFTLVNKNWDILRYPAGTLSNYFDWRSGWYIQEKHLPSGWLYDKFNYRRETNYLGNQTMDFAKNLNLFGGKPILGLNLLTSSVYTEAAMMYAMSEVNVPVNYIELGNEFYLSDEHYKKVFPSSLDYFLKAKDWVSKIRALQIPKLGDIKFAIVGEEINDAAIGRRKMWLSTILDNIQPGDEINAITFHNYFSVGFSKDDPANPCKSHSTTKMRRYLHQQFEMLDELESATFQAVRNVNQGKLVGHELDIWITEFNTLDDESPYTGSWLHGLANAAMLLKYLETPEITKVINHTMLSDGVFGNIFESNNDFANFTCHAKLPIGNPITRPGEFTAVGNALNQIGMALRNAVKATRVEFTGNNTPPILNLPDPNDIEYSSIYGWILEEVNSGPKQIILLNLNSNNDFKVTFNYSAANLNYTQLVSNDATSAILGNAQINPTSPYELIQTNTSIAPNSSGDFEFILPPHSITRIFEEPSIKAHLTDPVICSESSTTLIIDGGPENAEFTVTNTNIPQLSALSIGGVGTNDTRHWEITAPSVSSKTDYTIIVECTTCVPVISQNIDLTVYPDILDLQIKDNSGNPITSPIERCANAGTPFELRASFTPGSGGNPNTNNYTYIWTPDTGIFANGFGCNTNTLQLCNSISVAPQRTTTYTVFVTDDQCWKSASVVVEVPISELDLGEDFLVCSNSSTIELNSISTGSANLSYQWSPSGPTSPTWNYSIPTTPGSYPISLTVTDISSGSGCIVSDQVNIIVVQCCSTTTNSVWPTNQVNYETNLNEYYASGENLFNSLSTLCSGCISVFGTPNKNKILFESNNTNQILQVNGELRLERDFRDNAGTLLKDGFDVEIKDLKIQFGEKAFIRVRGGRTLTLDGCTLEACGAMMWDGLRIFPEATDLLPAIVLKNCTIKNASNALYLARDSRFIIENCTFIDNYIDINLNTYLKRVKQEPDAPVDPNDSKSTEYFIRSNTFTSSGNTLLAPYDNVHKFAAIVLDDAERVVIGDSSLDASVDANEFSSSRYGIVSFKSSLETFNNRFNDLLTFFEDWPAELPPASNFLKANSVGIYFHSLFDNNDRKLLIGERFDNSGVTDTRNVFTNMGYNVWTENETNAEIHFSDFGNGDEDAVSGTNCILINNPGNKAIEISKGNNFTNFLNGIRIIEPSQNSEISISTNNIFSGLPLNGGGFAGTGIMINHTSGMSPEKVSISENIIGGTLESAFGFPRIGIRIANIEGVEIEDNEIQFSLSNTPGFHYTGVWIENCRGANVKSNRILNIDPPNQLYQLEDLLVGLRVDNSHGTCIEQNNLEALGQGMRFSGNSIVYSLFRNTMSGFDQGVFLHSADIGLRQGWYGGIIENDLDNNWIRSNGPTTDRIQGQTWNGTPIDWNTRVTSVSDSRYPDGDLSVVTPFIITGSSYPFSQCPIEVSNDPPYSGNTRNAWFGYIAGDSGRYIENYYYSFKYQSEFALFKELKKFPSLLSLDDSSDVSFQSFYENAEVSNYAIFDSIESLIASGLMNIAYTMTEAIVDTNEIEFCQKKVWMIYLNKILQGDILNSVDSNLLDSIAHLNALVKGPGVRMARILLNLEIYDEIESNSRLASQTKKVEPPFDIMLVPNPASWVLKIFPSILSTHTMITIHDITGRILDQKSDTQVIDISSISSGSYLLKYEADGKTVSKLFIIKK
ncbi:MAG: T9SS type A sorting domain-containing protein [Bacteroidia bacterium]|nr:T9SS type A sorting domain-containing protein [Bacteroidia bacterium]